MDEGLAVMMIAVRMGLAVAVLLAAGMGFVGGATDAVAQSSAAQGAEHPAAKSYRRSGPRVRGYVQRRGGYSYAKEDSINTYGDSRSRFGSTSVYRDQMVDRQTVFGPFDHGFFFESGVAPRGGNSPYQN